jgi:hypothetical protein
MTCDTLTGDKITQRGETARLPLPVVVVVDAAFPSIPFVLFLLPKEGRITRKDSQRALRTTQHFFHLLLDLSKSSPHRVGIILLKTTLCRNTP